MTVRPLLIGCALVLSGAAPAAAATAEVGVGERANYTEWEVRYVAAPGERNEVAARLLPDNHTMRIDDPGATITPGNGCRSLTRTAVECTNAGAAPVPGMRPYLSALWIRAGDGDDVIRSTGEFGPALIADAGHGSDVLEGAARMADELDGGGGGRDRLAGRGNADALRDGDTPGAVDADVLDGGAGADADSVGYEGRTAPVRIDLRDDDPDGEAGERDVLRGIEHATGGSGDDDIDGNDRTNFLTGGPGDDHLDGHGDEDYLYGDAGRDRLHGHRGHDRLHGGPGADSLRGDAHSDTMVEPSRADRVSCGTGIDRFSQPADGILVPRACNALLYAFDPATGERVAPETEPPHGVSLALRAFPVAASRTSLTFSVGCPRRGDEERCAPRARHAIVVRSPGGRTLGTGRLDEERYRREARRDMQTTSRIVVRLTAAGRRLLARRGGAVASVTLRNDDIDVARWTARLTAR